MPQSTNSTQPGTKSRKRKSTGKRLRFEVFNRDNFTCQYCGAQPPDIVFVCDHIEPVASGGQTTIDNLITACEPCNQGKADKPLGDRAIRPDSDLLYLQTQQEIAELRRYTDALEQKQQVIAEVADSLVQRWFLHDPKANYAPRWLPDSVKQLLDKYDPSIVADAIDNVAGKVAGDYLGYGQDTARYLAAVARNMAAESEEGFE